MKKLCESPRVMGDSFIILTLRRHRLHHILMPSMLFPLRPDGEAARTVLQAF